MSDYPPPVAYQPPYPAGPYPPEGRRPSPRWAAGAMRQLTVAVGPTRTALLHAVRVLDFTTTTEQLTVLRAERGSRLRGLSLTATRVPVSLEITLATTGDDGGAALDIRIEDGWGSAARTPSAAAVYAEVFSEVLTGIDEHLARVDPAAARTFAPWWRVLPEDLVAAGASGAAGAARLEAAVRRRSARLLDGPRQRPVASAAGAGVDGLVITVPGAMAQVSTEVADGMLTAGQLVVSNPGGMPAALVEQVHGMVAALESQLAEAQRTGRRGVVTLEVAPADKPVVTFLFQQASLRDKLPLRELSTCTTCRLEKVVNPALIADRERSRRIRVLQSSVGAVFGSHSVSPFILFGRFNQLRKTDPDFVCGRCQGTDADEKPITFCPRCGDRRAESVLRTCTNCDLDLRSVLPQREVWAEIEEPPPVEEGWGPPTLSTELSSELSSEPPVSELSSPPLPEPSAEIATPAGWYPDPWRQHAQRYWDGAAWTAHVG